MDGCVCGYRCGGDLYSECLINIVAVFFHFSVNGHKTFIVSSCYAAFVSGCTSEIKHVPDMAGPDPWTFFQHFCHMLMVQRLIFLTVVLACRVRTVIRDDSFTSILRQSKADFRMNFMEVVHPRTIVFHFPAIPSEIMVVAFHIHIILHGGDDHFYVFLLSILLLPYPFPPYITYE